jgi:hypothetical protein
MNRPCGSGFLTAKGPNYKEASEVDDLAADIRDCEVMQRLSF